MFFLPPPHKFKLGKNALISRCNMPHLKPKLIIQGNQFNIKYEELAFSYQSMKIESQELIIKTRELRARTKQLIAASQQLRATLKTQNIHQPFCQNIISSKYN